MASRHFPKLTTIWLCLVAHLAFGISAYADDSSEDNLRALQEEIEHSLISPCCWNMTVDQHDSPAAKKVRGEIAVLLKEGKTKGEILTYFTDQPQYGERILAAPSQKTLLGKLAYWLIPMAMVFGLFVVGMTIRRLVRRPGSKQLRAQEGQPVSSALDDRVESELKNFDA